MEQFDKRLRAMAEREAVSTPEGFDGRLRETLDSLPPRTKKRRGPGLVKGALIAAAACALLAGSAFAASPGLREMLAEALGGFAPYVQEQEDDVYRWNGFEIKVLSAMADETTIRVYAQVTDMEKRDRLDVHKDGWRKEGPIFDIGGLESNHMITGGEGGSSIVSYDETTQTGVVVAKNSGVITDDLSGARFKADEVGHWLDDPWNPPVSIPLDVEIMSSKTVLRNIKAAEIPVEEIRMSALGMTLKWEKVYDYVTESEMDLYNAKVSVEMKDGTMIGTEYERASGQGSYIDSDTGREYKLMIWTFADPVEADQAAGVHIGDDYFPIQ